MHNSFWDFRQEFLTRPALISAVAWWVLPKSANATANALEQALEVRIRARLHRGRLLRRPAQRYS